MEAGKKEGKNASTKIGNVTYIGYRPCRLRDRECALLYVMACDCALLHATAQQYATVRKCTRYHDTNRDCRRLQATSSSFVQLNASACDARECTKCTRRHATVRDCAQMRKLTRNWTRLHATCMLLHVSISNKHVNTFLQSSACVRAYTRPGWSKGNLKGGCLPKRRGHTKWVKLFEEKMIVQRDRNGVRITKRNTEREREREREIIN